MNGVTDVNTKGNINKIKNKAMAFLLGYMR
jgi:hypothetical protein